MAGLHISTKRVQLDKTNSSIVVAVSIAAVVIAFSLVSAKALLGQYSYQSKVITEQKKALKIAKDNITTSQQLVAAYQVFNSQPGNIIGGSAAGAGERDGDNSKIILDALPGQYDYPAVISSVEKILTQRGFKIESLSGTDDAEQGLAAVAEPAAPVANSKDDKATPAPAEQPVAVVAPIEMPFSFKVLGSYQSMNDLVVALEKSIRPVSITTLKLTGEKTSVSLTVDAKTYYQPSTKLTFTEKVIK